jgi:hypothetical protein
MVRASYTVRLYGSTTAVATAAISPCCYLLVIQLYTAVGTMGELRRALISSPMAVLYVGSRRGRGGGCSGCSEYVQLYRSPVWYPIRLPPLGLRQRRVHHLARKSVRPLTPKRHHRSRPSNCATGACAVTLLEDLLALGIRRHGKGFR